MVTLKTILRSNAASCVGFGLLFLSTPASVAGFLSETGPAPSWVIVALGLGLIANGGHLLWAAQQPCPSKALIDHFSLGDFIWVLATALLIIFGLWITSIQGIIAALIVAAVVGTLGVLQKVKYHKA